MLSAFFQNRLELTRIRIRPTIKTRYDFFSNTDLTSFFKSGFGSDHIWPDADPQPCLLGEVRVEFRDLASRGPGQDQDVLQVELMIRIRTRNKVGSGSVLGIRSDPDPV